MTLFIRKRIVSWCLVILIALATGSVSASAEENTFYLGGHEITVVGELGGFDLDVDLKKVENGLEIASFTLSHETPTTPPQLMLKWSVPSVDIAGVWTPAYNESSILPADWSSAKLESMLTRNAPVFTLFGYDDVNRLTVSVSDALNHINMAARVREEDARIYNSIELFSQPHNKITSYEVQIRFDQRESPFYTALKDVSSWWAQQENYTPTPVPAVARMPMYSTWYSYHQDITHEALIEEVKLAGKMGFKAIIVDDGWQTTDSNRGYAYTGDWKPERLKEIKRFVDEVHSHDMKALLWYSLPFVGENSEAVKQFEGKFLSHREGLQTYVLDPRYPEVREFLIEHYRHAIRDWGWDGLKLDFIDQFKSDENTVLEIADGRDYASVYESVDRLMTDTITELRKINPDVMVEFRQRYIGPLMRKYGNMFRATDIPNGAITNRFRIVSLRVLSGDTAVHSDMIMWNREEPVEIAALQFLNILFSVPQVSVRLADIPQKHFDMVAYYTNYWSENQGVLLDGEFRAHGIFAKYPLISAQNKDKLIVGLYDNQVVEFGDDVLSSIDIINAKKSTRVVVNVPVDLGKYKVTIKDSMGKVQDAHEADLRAGVLSFDVPVSGMLSLESTRIK